MINLREILQLAMTMPDYREWEATRPIIQARATLAALFLGGSLLFWWHLPTFGICFSIALGFFVGAGLDFLFGGSFEGFRRGIKAWRGPEGAEAKRLESLAVIDHGGFAFHPRFISGLKNGLWIKLAELERASGHKVLPTTLLCVSRQQAKCTQQWNGGEYLPLAMAYPLCSKAEPLGAQFTTTWLKTHALPYWERLEAEAKDFMP